MGLFFNRKKIARVELYEQIDGLDEDDKYSNLALGHMFDGFTGYVMADLYNADHSAKTVFLVTYTDGTSELIETENDSSDYRYYRNKMQ